MLPGQLSARSNRCNRRPHYSHTRQHRQSHRSCRCLCRRRSLLCSCLVLMYVSQPPLSPSLFLPSHTNTPQTTQPSYCATTIITPSSPLATTSPHTPRISSTPARFWGKSIAMDWFVDRSSTQMHTSTFSPILFSFP